MTSDAELIKSLQDKVAYLEAELEKYRHILSMTPGTLYWMDRSGHYQGCNENTLKLLKMQSEKEFIGKKVTDLFSPEISGKLDEIDKQVMSENKAYLLEEESINANGEAAVYLTHKKPMHDNKGNVIGMLGVSFDISQRKDQLDYLNREYQQVKIYLDNVLRYAKEMIYWTNKDGLMLGCNKAQLNMFGLTDQSQLIGKNVFELAEAQHWPEKLLQDIRKNDLEVMKTKKPLIREETVIINGEVHICLSSKNPLLNEKGEVIGVFGISTDISDRKRMEENLKEAKNLAEQASQAKTEFLMNISHDLRTPFSGVLGFAKVLAAKETDPTKQEYLGYMITSTQRLLAFINRILEVVRGDATEITKNTRFDLKQLIIDSSELLTAEIHHKNLQLTIDYASGLPHVFFSQMHRIKIVIINLLTNAVKFTEQGGVTIAVDGYAIDKTYWMIKITVRDTGVGIATEDYQKLFRQFSRVQASHAGKYEGVGLGLWMIKKIIDDLNGKIEVESEVNVGTTFTCILPLLGVGD